MKREHLQFAATCLLFSLFPPLKAAAVEVDGEVSGASGSWQIVSHTVQEVFPRASTEGHGVDIFTPNGKPSVIIFVKDSLCVHCREQVIEMGKKLPHNNVDVFVVSASNEEDLLKFPPLPFRLVADADHRLSKHFGVFTHEPKHATIVRDGSGTELLRKVGDEPYNRIDAVSIAIDEALARSR